MRRIALACLAVFAFASMARAEDPRPKIVLELYTSQACAQSPAADAVLSRLASRPDVIALSLPISYWNYLGWKDTLANDAHNKRQLQHAAHRQDRLIYTPQLVINGVMQTNGAIEPLVHALIKQTMQSITPATVPMEMDTEGTDLVVHIGAAPEGSAHRTGEVWLALYSTSVVVNIGGGENGGRQMIYRNVVRELRRVGRWEGTEARFAVPRAGALAGAVDGSAALLQTEDAGAIIGAAKLELVATN